MSHTASKAMQPLRIIALPLTRPNLRSSAVIQGAVANKPSMLTYYQFQLSKPRRKEETKPEGEVRNGILSKWVPEEGAAKWASNKATDMWTGWGKAKQGSWQLWVHRNGERLVDRIDFEELALKGIDPSLGPTILHPDIRGRESKNVQPVSIPLVFPPSITSSQTTLADLRTLLAQRAPKHRKGFITWAIIAPFTAPFMIIPIIPNLPFFFCVWRSWSHYKAFRASQYLQSLLDNGSITPQESHSLDTVYKDYHPNTISSRTPDEQPQQESEASTTSRKHEHEFDSLEQRRHSSNTSASDGTTSPPTASKSTNSAGSEPLQEMLLHRDAVPAIMSLFSVKGSAEAELYRALEQAKLRAEGERKDGWFGGLFKK